VERRLSPSSTPPQVYLWVVYACVGTYAQCNSTLHPVGDTPGLLASAAKHVEGCRVGLPLLLTAA
jgi:hypothetical protein